MDRITVVQVRKAFNYLQKMLPNAKLELHSYSAGRYRSYRIMSDGGKTPFGSEFWLGAQQAYDGIWLIMHTIEFYEKYKKESAMIEVAKFWHSVIEWNYS